MVSLFEAEQDNPRRTAALEVVTTGVLSDEMRRRFELEARSGFELSRRVVDDRGRALLGADVRIVRLGDLDDARITGDPIARMAVSTDEGRRARSKPLAEGRYRVEVSRTGYFEGVSEPVDVSKGERRHEVIEWCSREPRP